MSSLENFFDKINDYGSVSIKLASPEDIRSWSYGEVKKPETINYRTYRPEKDGLFCEKIFGPERDWECSCGKYRGSKHRGIVCDRCGVKVIHSRVRRKRMGHINLASPVAHIWFVKATPSRMGTLLALKTASLEKVINLQEYIVINPGDTPLREKQLLKDNEYLYYKEKIGDRFEAGTGAEAIKKILERLNLDKLTQELRKDLEKTRSKQRQREISRRLRLVEMLRDSSNRPEWMVLDVIPVMPPDLRPLVLLDSGNFATSDLNDLYRRLINRNNRLKRLLELNAPQVIVRNEKRMLQQSVDALFDNNRCRRPVLGSSNRPLKSLTDMIKGKQGRFRENLLGKRVDYSARSVIVVGPELKLHQCGLPKKIALELFQPFIIRRLKELGLSDTIKSAKKKLERKDEEVWDILEEVIQHHPVLLNRAPTLHRMGIQAFEPVLIEGNAIKIHPLVCTGFNADFDGDQMAVHLPLSVEAQVEASALMLCTGNIFSHQNGKPIVAPSQDIVLGCYYLTVPRTEEPGSGMIFRHAHEGLMAYDRRVLGMHAWIYLRVDKNKRIRGEGFGWEKPGRFVIDGTGKNATRRFVPSAETETEEAGATDGERAGEYIRTTAGRLLFNDIAPEGIPYYNLTINKKTIGRVIEDCHRFCGWEKTLDFLDDLKELGFKAATRAGLSFGKNDLRIPEMKEKILGLAEAEVKKVETSFKKGAITPLERHNKIVEIWTHTRERVGQEMMTELKNDVRGGKPYLNPIFAMADSGARGSIDQIRQLAGMRGLMAKPSGQIIETPIRANFREGLKVLEYFSSTHGARKGLADTALKTADSGYLTRKLADVAQNVVVNEHDCGSIDGITKTMVMKGEKVEMTLAEQIFGRVLCSTIKHPMTGKAMAKTNELLTVDKAAEIEELGYDRVKVRSPLTCKTPQGCCALCYGMDLSTGKLVEEGLAVGIMAAQSIGEPGTQLTMRTFHIGGVAFRELEESEKRFQPAVDRKLRDSIRGEVKFVNLRIVEKEAEDTKIKERIVLNRNGFIHIAFKDPRDGEIKEDKHLIPTGASILVEAGTMVKPGTRIAAWDPHHTPILAERPGIVQFEDIIPKVTMKEEVDPQSGIKRKVIIEHKGDKHPQINIRDPKDEDKVLAFYAIPEKANIEIDDGKRIQVGTLLAKTPREISGTQDITGGLPRVTEIFEARRPKNPAIISELDGIVRLGKKRRGKRTIVVEGAELSKEHMVPHGRHLRVSDGDLVRAGDALVDGPQVPHDILRILDPEALYQYLIREVQAVYRAQGVTINDKHIEIIVSQMMRKVLVEEPADTACLPGAVVDRFVFEEENKRVLTLGAKPAQKPVRLLLGITKAALSSDSFISAASFQETTKILTEAALAGKRDELRGLKENVILGHMIPAGTGFKAYYQGKIAKHIPPELEKILEERRKRRESMEAIPVEEEEEEPRPF